MTALGKVVRNRHLETRYQCRPLSPNAQRAFLEIIDEKLTKIEKYERAQVTLINEFIKACEEIVIERQQRSDERDHADKVRRRKHLHLVEEIEPKTRIE